MGAGINRRSAGRLAVSLQLKELALRRSDECSGWEGGRKKIPPFHLGVYCRIFQKNLSNPFARDKDWSIALDGIERELLTTVCQ